LHSTRIIGKPNELGLQRITQPPPTQSMTSSNENKMSDGGRNRASVGMKVWKSSQKWSVQRSAVRSIAWLGLCGFIGGRGATI